MKNHRQRRKRCVIFGLVGMLAYGNIMMASATELPTFGQYMSGETMQGIPETEGEYSVISISTEEDLALLAQNCLLDSWSQDKYIKLENDIILQKYTSIMISNFAGIFDGCGYKISGLDIRQAGSSYGLFRYIQSSGEVKNLSVMGKIAPEGSKNRIGILAGVNYGKIINCNVSGSVSGADKVGGIAGVNEETGEIRQCQSSAIVIGNHFTGGICGMNRGVLNHCENVGSINTYSLDVTYDFEDITMENIEEINSSEHVSAHTDTGGIAGYSQGKIYYCTNGGNVGYQHVGYNTGGIVGRLHQGYLQNCTNTGHILGRKDVGGIVGQMEPFLEVQYLNDKLSEIDRETDRFFDLLEASHEDLSKYSSEAADLTGQISGNLTNASNAAGELTGAAIDLWYIYNQELTGINDDLNRLNQEWAEQAEIDKNKNEENNKPDNGSGTGNQESSQPDDPTISVEGNHITSDNSWNENKPWDEKPWEGDENWDIGIDLESYFAALRRFGEGTNNHLNNMTNATNDRSGGINDNLEILNRELEAAGNHMKQLSDVLSEGTEQTSANVDALMEQAKILRRSINELRDDLFQYEGISIEDASDETDESIGTVQNQPGTISEEIYYDTTTFQRGKITLCVNDALVEADTNVGGIVGQVATEYDFDPEDDITFSGEESFHMEQTVKAIVRECRNMGEVIGKKDYVGGIVGKADFGAVISCESYGPVSSTGGSYVGGIVGLSGYCVRSSYFMGEVSGKNNVGGIVGKGCDIFYSYSYPRVDFSGEYAGSIAGEVEENGILYGNYYVQSEAGDNVGVLYDVMLGDTLPGVDSIGYTGGAEPVGYTEFCSMPGVPKAFFEFTITFRAEGQELASIQCHYGDAIDSTCIPEIPEKEGYYGVWPGFDREFITGSKILEAQYEKWTTSLASEEKNEDGKTRVLVQGEFLPNTKLILEDKPEGTQIGIVTPIGGEESEKDGQMGENDRMSPNNVKPFTVRVLWEDSAENTIVEILTEGSYRQVPVKVIGSYLEFAMDEPGIFRVTTVEEDNSNIILMICCGVLGAALLLLLLNIIGKHRKKKMVREQSEEAA